MDSQPKVNVLIATYNGEKYLKKQLDSITNQTYNNIDIYIRDDGSKDLTVDVIREYVRNNSKKNIYLLENNGTNLKCPQSFYEIMRHCNEAKYYSLCDQDDIWYPDKIERAVNRLEEENNKDILLYYSACNYSEENGKLIRKSPVQKEKLKLQDVLYYTPGSGFTIVINELTRQNLILNVNPGSELHDRWLIRGAVCFGKVVYDKVPSASHIRHEDAVTAGDASNNDLLFNFVRKELFGDDSKKETDALLYFRKIFSDKLSKKELKILDLFSKVSLINRLKKTFYPKRLRRRIGGEIALRLLFLLGKA